MLVDVWGFMVRPCARIRRSQGRAQRVITPTIRRTLMDNMCYPVDCPNCAKNRWAGCGQHVDEMTRAVSASQRCRCRPDLVNAAQDRAGRQGGPGTRSR